MTIVQHNFDGSLIAQSGEITEIMGNTIPKGWVNATAMCKANNKTWSNYWKTDKAKSFAGKVSTAREVRQSSVLKVVTKKTYRELGFISK